MLLTHPASLTRAFVEALWALPPQGLGEADLATARGLLLDHLGVVANGARTDSATAFRRLLEAPPYLAAGPSLPLIGATGVAPATGAAMANAIAGHSIEFDDTHSASSLHPGVVIFPAAFATAALIAAENGRVVDGRTFLHAAILGYEVMCRVGRAANPAAQYRRNFHPTGTCGHFGAAATAAVLLGLEVDAAVSALGIAGTMAAGGMQFLEDGSWTKRFHPALAARNGVEAAFMARAGFVGSDDSVAGAKGFLAAHSDAPDPDQLLARWGERRLEIHYTSIKAHACCRYNQGPLDAVLQIRADHQLTPNDVASVTVGLVSTALPIVAEPVEAKRRPTSVVDAQFSMPFAAAVALKEGRAGLAQYQADRLDDPTVRALMDRVECIADPALDRTYPEEWRAWVRMTTTDGRTVEHSVNTPRGDPDNPFSSLELRAKFAELTAEVYPDARQTAIFAAIDDIEEPGGLARLERTLTTQAHA